MSELTLPCTTNEPRRAWIGTEHCNLQKKERTCILNNFIVALCHVFKTIHAHVGVQTHTFYTKLLRWIPLKVRAISAKIINSQHINFLNAF